jgi:hypothetical protein
MAKKKKDKKTLVCFILDETGSMYGYKQPTIDGYNEYVDALRDEKDFKLMLTRFNTEEISISEPEPIKKALKLDEEIYQPRATTPLYDAIASSIKRAERHSNKSTAVLVVIMTDGLENDSREYKRETVFRMIEDKQKAGWQFAFLGANQDAYAASQNIGISRGSSFNYDQKQTVDTFATAAGATMRYSKGGSKASDTFFNDEDRKDEAEPE